MVSHPISALACSQAYVIFSSKPADGPPQGQRRMQSSFSVLPEAEVRMAG